MKVPTAAVRSANESEPGESGAVLTAGACDHPDIAALFAGRSVHVTGVATLTPRAERAEPWPSWVPASVVNALQATGIHQPWRHQVETADLAYRRQHVIVTTGTASGKSLACLLPGFAAIAAAQARGSGQRRTPTVLYISPTKALAADQLARIRAWAVPGVCAAIYDGDSSPADRSWARRYANVVLTNPDMVHYGLLPGHRRWTSLWRGLRYVVVDECHCYRGIFGAQVAAVLRRLRRICRHYGADPVFVCASATVAEPDRAALLLTGVPARVVRGDAAPRAPLRFAFVEPTGGSAVAEAAYAVAQLVARGQRVIAYINSRRGTEILAAAARRHLETIRPSAVHAVAAYRGGYLPDERRRLEAGLRSGRLRGLAATSALELGVDVAGIDAVVLVGFPGTRASLWQQVGRAGRRNSPALALFIARDDPLDRYLVRRPETLLDGGVEAFVFDPGNPYVLAPQVCAAAAEMPLTSEDVEVFSAPPEGSAPLGGVVFSASPSASVSSGGSAPPAPSPGPATPGASAPAARPAPLNDAAALFDDLARRGLLRRRRDGWHWVRRESPTASIDLRGAGGGTVDIVELPTGQLLGTATDVHADVTLHPGAVYVHQGQSFLVESYDAAARAVLVRAADVDYVTIAEEVTDIRVVETVATTMRNTATVCFGRVAVLRQVVGFARKRLLTGEFLGRFPLEPRTQRLATKAVWWTVEEDALRRAALTPERCPGAAHAAEHAAIGLLPLFATCDRWDIGGVSTAWHPDTGRLTVFVYDGYPGGAGIAERGYTAYRQWLHATRDAIARCACDHGCPSCIQSPKCGNGNEPLDKAGAIELLDVVLAGG
ncbi:MAG: DEAD/DEAH box helicase [Acidothermus cellulolyticus]|nr:DEAD/DEAH box helicase [Acidothermus cellulolyticus]